MKFKEKYFHTVAIACGVGFLLGVSGIAKAESYYQMATVESVQPMFKQITTRVPSQVCTEVDVPIYGQSGGHDKTGDILGGAIIGGIIGNQIGNAKGNGAAGAVIGGLLGNAHGNNRKSDVVVGYRKETQCSTSYTNEVNEHFAGNRVTASYNGMKVNFTTSKQVQPGDEVPIRVTISAR